MNTRTLALVASMALTGAILPACDGTTATTPDGGSTADMSPTPSDGGGTCNDTFKEDVSACMPAGTDYQPRKAPLDHSTWAACISDDGTFHMIGPSLPPSASRSVAFDSMGQKLWKNANTPTADDFLKARDEYSVPEGILSRVSRRQDVHYPEVPGGDKFACANMGVPAMYPDRCAGPAKVLPIVTDAFEKGIKGEKPRVQAARIEAGLLWFFYMSTMSEVWTCSFDDIEDCDAQWGYYNGSKDRANPIGMGAYFKALGPATYDRGFDAVLAVRCWRDLDKAMPATDKKHHDLASAQLDKAELRALALVLRERLGKVACLTGENQEAQLEFSRILGGFLDREARARDAKNADVIKAQLAVATAEKVDVKAAQAAIDALFGCP